MTIATIINSLGQKKRNCSADKTNKIDNVLITVKYIILSGTRSLLLINTVFERKK